MRHSFEQSRRTFLKTTGAAGAAGLTGLAGCAGGSPDELTVAYMPIYPDMQHFVMEKEGYYGELDAEVKATEFTDGPSIIQAYAGGGFDVALFGIVPALITIAKTGSSKVTAANIQNAMKILASDEFADMYAEHGADAFQEFEEQKGRKFTFGTFPSGSTPDILLRYWLRNELGLDPQTAVNIKGLGGAGPVRQALLAGEIDGTSIMEPIPTIIEAKDAPFQSIAWAGNFMPGQPAAVALMRDDLRKNRTDLAEGFVEQHVRATNFTHDNPDAAAKDAAQVIGTDVLPVDIAQQAMQSKASDFISNPHEIAEPTKVFAEYTSRLKGIEKLSNDQVFDFSVYDSVVEE
ncbi:ABC transporter substrate-binding protein [Halospeciosus flavus]|uniref:ABC transporter substrate-binding protein n=1 Tax=Halospeciosus flavus TaxID=3032283 RepID=A0ABD5Z4S0_9EURY|nr:ABC transporter substrate-binding protein [Halospeciosus flavus]